MTSGGSERTRTVNGGLDRPAAEWDAPQGFSRNINPVATKKPEIAQGDRNSGPMAPAGFGNNARMPTLFHHPFCPHSRFVRLALGEYGVATRLIEERTWERRRDFLAINPAGTTPVLVDEGQPPVPGAAIIAEYLDEALRRAAWRAAAAAARGRPAVEVRRLMSWFNDKFFAEVSGPLTTERFYKRHMPVNAGGGSPDTDVIRAARNNIRYHLAYIGWLVRTRDWLAGDQLSYADLAAAAHLSAADYLGDVPWNEDEAAKSWYARVKSRPSFRPLLAETLAGIPPSQTYADLDF